MNTLRSIAPYAAGMALVAAALLVLLVIGGVP